MNADDVQRAVKAAMDAALGETGAALTEVRAYLGKAVEMEGLRVNVSVEVQRLVVREADR